MGIRRVKFCLKTFGDSLPLPFEGANEWLSNEIYGSE